MKVSPTRKGDESSRPPPRGSTGVCTTQNVTAKVRAFPRASLALLADLIPYRRERAKESRDVGDICMMRCFVAAWKHNADGSLQDVEGTV